MSKDILLHMLFDWLPKALFFIVVAIILGLFRRMAPPRSRSANWKYDKQQIPEPLPTGVVGGAMWALGIGLVLTFFLLSGANQLWASFDGPADLTLYATTAIWCFFPLFAALAIPWPLTVWYLRKIGRKDEADSISDEADLKSGMDTFRVMKWLSVGLVGPIAFFTFLAIPTHFSIGKFDARLGRYASVHTERFPFGEARRATLIDGIRLRNGSFRSGKDIVIDFADGRRLSGNAVGDGRSDVPDSVVQLLLSRTGLRPGHARTVEEIPPL
jgi:hypothetical protein